MREPRQAMPTVASTRYAVPVNNNSHRRAQRKKELAIASLLSSRTITEAAERCDMSLRSMQRLMAQVDFRQSYQEAKEQALDSAIGILRRASDSFASGLVELAQDKSVVPLVRLAACSRGLEIVLRIYGQANLERQVDELESAIARLEGEAR
jgi:hypothetical protein